MRLYIFMGVFLLLSACHPPVPVKQMGMDGQTHTIEGYGFAIKDGVFIYKNHVVNNAVGGCTGEHGIPEYMFQGRCAPQSLRNVKIYVKALKEGQYLQEAMGNPIIGVGTYGVSGEIQLPMKPTYSDKDQCFFMVTQSGGNIPVRDGKGMERYLFTNPLYSKQNQRKGSKNLLSELERMLQLSHGRLQSSQNILRNSSAYKGGRCVTPKRRRFPPKPRTMSMEQAKFQAEGACFDLLASRHPVGKINNAMGAIGRRDMIYTHRKWVKSQPASCARVDLSQTTSWLCDVSEKIFGIHAFRGCVQDLIIGQCVPKIMNQCVSPLLEWERKVQTIKGEPKAQKRICENAIATYNRARRNIPQTEQKITKEKAKISANSAKQSDLSKMIDLKYARCGFF